MARANCTVEDLVPSALGEVGEIGRLLFLHCRLCIVWRRGEAGAALTTTFFQRLATRSPGKSAFDFKARSAPGHAACNVTMQMEKRGREWPFPRRRAMQCRPGCPQMHSPPVPQDMLFLMYPEKSSRDLAFMELETRPPPPVVEETADPVKEAVRLPFTPKPFGLAGNVPTTVWLLLNLPPPSRDLTIVAVAPPADTPPPRAPQDVDDMFSIWDEDGSGTLDKDEFKEMLRKLGEETPARSKPSPHDLQPASASDSHTDS